MTLPLNLQLPSSRDKNLPGLYFKWKLSWHILTNGLILCNGSCPGLLFGGLGKSGAQWKFDMSIWYEFLDKYFPKKSNFVMSQLDQYFAAFPLFITPITSKCAKSIQISPPVMSLLIPYSQILLQRASLSAIWKNITKKYMICLHTSLFIHCKSFITHSQNSIRLWHSNWGNKTKMPFWSLSFNKNILCCLERVSETVLHVPCLLVKNLLH